MILIGQAGHSGQTARVDYGATASDLRSLSRDQVQGYQIASSLHHSLLKLQPAVPIPPAVHSQLPWAHPRPVVPATPTQVRTSTRL